MPGYRRESAVKFRRVTRLHRLELYPKRLRRHRGLSQLWLVAWVPRIPEGGHAGNLRNDLLQHLQLLWYERGSCARYPRDVSLRSRQTRDEFRRDGIDNNGHNDRNRRCCVLGCPDRWRSDGNNDVHFQMDELGHEAREPVVPRLRKSVLDDKVLTLDPPELA